MQINPTRKIPPSSRARMMNIRFDDSSGGGGASGSSGSSCAIAFLL